MNNLPSNFSLTEVMKFIELPEQARKLIEELIFVNKELEAELDCVDETVEGLMEQIYQRDSLIETILTAAIETTKHKDLVVAINNAYDDAGIEL
jgi:hypothetical protein